MIDAASAPVAQPVHLREQWNEVTNVWTPGEQCFNVESSEHAWATTDREGLLSPVPHFAEHIFRSVLAGQVCVISVPETQKILHPGTFGSNLLSVHRQLAGLLSEKVIAETGDLSYHARKFAPDSMFDGIGFRTPYAKVLPPHYDLALYYRGDQAVYMPAHVTLIAWGARGDARKEVTNHFFDVQGFHADRSDAVLEGTPFRTCAPAVYAFMKDAQIHSESNKEYRFPVSIPEGAITVFANRGLAHGAEYSVFRSARALNRRLSSLDQNRAVTDPDSMVPIDVLLL
jgi:hypothetical protein